MSPRRSGRWYVMPTRGARRTGRATPRERATSECAPSAPTTIRAVTASPPTISRQDRSAAIGSVAQPDDGAAERLEPKGRDGLRDPVDDPRVEVRATQGLDSRRRR